MHQDFRDFPETFKKAGVDMSNSNPRGWEFPNPTRRVWSFLLRTLWIRTFPPGGPLDSEKIRSPDLWIGNLQPRNCKFPDPASGLSIIFPPPKPVEISASKASGVRIHLAPCCVWHLLASFGIFWAVGLLSGLLDSWAVVLFPGLECPNPTSVDAFLLRIQSPGWNFRPARFFPVVPRGSPACRSSWPAASSPKSLFTSSMASGAFWPRGQPRSLAVRTWSLHDP